MLQSGICNLQSRIACFNLELQAAICRFFVLYNYCNLQSNLLFYNCCNLELLASSITVVIWNFLHLL
ncbi:hypothetical protein H5410_001965 [Solanum commersonii]|uniref:Uncharacterized protein n=1 Tax=Solanum commersonii TaxID=4109 RepID=A0A9J6B0L2_SOLCO|nr:hypothetical protein H5410_001965 [Solanum commersonii]